MPSAMSPHAAAVWTVVSKTLGWAYFFCWSFSFYPQIILNFKNRSVTGLSVDFVVASFIGFFCYAVFTCCMYWNPGIQAEYMSRHDGEDNLVELNDVIFTLHATAINLVYVLQVLMFRKPGEGMSKVGAASSVSITIGAGITLLLSIFGVVKWLDFLYLLSYVKLSLTVVKYIPQVYMNYVRKSTTGWSIINVMLDFAGGCFSIMQILLDCWISGHWSGIMGFMIKLALGIVTLFFDTIFLLQHYVWFPASKGPHVVDMAEIGGVKGESDVDLKGSIPPSSPYAEKDSEAYKRV